MIFQYFSLCLLILLGISLPNVKSDSPPSSSWEDYKGYFGKNFVSSTSESKHKANFLQKVEEVKRHNEAFKKGKETFSLELNQFSDMDSATFKKLYTGYEAPKRDVEGLGVLTDANFSSISALAESFDWRSKGKVSPVKNQQSCGSCWSFSAAGAVESQMLIHYSDTTLLSEQQLVDCDRANKGCNGGHQTRAWQYMQQNGGLTSQDRYPYRARQGSCQNPGNVQHSRVASYDRVRGSADTIMRALQEMGPLAIAVDANSFQSYKGGILRCSNPRLNHAILLVGYGSENGRDYWIIKNSWGTRWGEKGYAKISRNSREDCGISQDVLAVSIV